MGRHATTERRRGVAAWPIVAVVTALLLVAAVVVYFVVVVRDDNAATACSSTEVLQVATSPDTAVPVTAAARAWSDTAPVVRGTCFSAEVTTVDNVVLADALIASGGQAWNAAGLPAPAVWVVDEETDLLQVDSAQSALTAGRSTTPLATSPVVLAMAAAPSELPSWADLAAAGGSDLVLPGAGSRSSVEAAESMIAATAATVDPLTADQVTAAADLLAALGTKVSDRPLSELLAEVTADGPAVVVQESLLLADNAARGASTPVAVLPTGATAGAEVYAVPLVAPWTSPAQQDAAAQFDSYLAGTGQADFAAAGFRVQGDVARPTPGAADGNVTFLPSSTPTARSAILDGLAGATGGATEQPGTEQPGSDEPSAPETSPAEPSSPEPTTSAPAEPSEPSAPESSAPTESSAAPAPEQTGPTVLVLLDRSTDLNDTQDDRSLNEWVQLGIDGLVSGAPQTGLGLWTCGSAADSAAVQVVAPGPLAELVDGVPRAQTVAAAMAAQVPEGTNHTYGCLNELWPTFGTVPVPEGQQRIVVLLTAGVDRTPSLSRATLLDTVEGSSDARLEVIGLNSEVNETAMTAIAEAGGGSYQQIDPADLTTTLLGLTG